MAFIQRTAFLLAVLSTAAVGCVWNDPHDMRGKALETEPEPVEAGARFEHNMPSDALPLPLPVGWSVEGRPINCTVHGSGEDVLLILGGIHGNEPASAVLADRLALHLEAVPYLTDGKKIVIAPALNPDGLAGNRRVNSRGVDLNRNFGTKNRRISKKHGLEPLSEPESRFIAGLILLFQPDRIVSIHQPLACVDWDGPAKELAEAVSEASGLPVKKLGARPGSLGSYAGVDLEIPIITLELPADATHMKPEEVWERYGMALLAVIHASGNG